MSDTKKVITVEKMERSVHSGDWHDKPLRWIVRGPGGHQMFATKKDAMKFRSVYRMSDSLVQAIFSYARIPC